jgi:hypothetical protein
MAGRGGRFRVTLCVAALTLAPTTVACSSKERPHPDTLGFRAGGGLFNEEAFLETEEWLGRDVRFTVQFTGRKSQRDMNGSAFGLLTNTDASIDEYAERLSLSLTIPLGFGNANAQTRTGREQIARNLEAVARGDFDAAYQRVARRLVDAGFGDAILRLGHEFNGAWAPWSSQTNEQAFIAAWRHVHNVMSEASPDFVFDWTAIRPTWTEWGPIAYPGDDYVDIIGLDVYWRVQRGENAWDPELWRQDFENVMTDHHAFAVAHDKPVSYPEWGLEGADAPQFIDAMHGWFSSLPTEGPGSLVYHAYFDGNRELDLDRYPVARDRFKALFGDS